MIRKKLSKSGSRHLFSQTGKMTHKKNLQPVPMRGGFRL